MPDTKYRTASIPFKMASRVIRLIGNVTEHPKDAIWELVKNAYDADATEVKISFDVSENDKIIVRDNGRGMEKDVISNIWFQPGASLSVDLGRKKTLKFGRRVYGKKGVGKFSTQLIGNTMTLYTRPKNSKVEYVSKMDWRWFDDDGYMEDIELSLEEREPVMFKDSYGTAIEISDIIHDRFEYNALMFKEIYEHLQKMFSPFDEQNFNISFTSTPNIDVEIDYNTIKLLDIAPFRATGIISGNQYQYTYTFNPDIFIPDIEGRSFTSKKHTNLSIIERSEVTGLARYGEKDFDEIGIGDVRVEVCIFPRYILGTLYNSSSELGSMLDLNYGVRVYRGGIRIYDYGEPGCDWLGFDNIEQNRIKMFSNFHPDIYEIVAAVFLDKTKSTSLVENLNGRGFQDGEALTALRSIVASMIHNIYIDAVSDCLNAQKYYATTDDLLELTKKVQTHVESTDRPSIEILGDYLNKVSNFFDEHTIKDKNINIIIPDIMVLLEKIKEHSDNTMVTILVESIMNLIRFGEK